MSYFYLDFDTMMWGQLEADRQRREREAAAAQQSQYQQPYIDPTIYIHRSVFVWNDETGNSYYLPCETEKDGMFAKRSIIKRAEKLYKKMYGEKPNRHIDWGCSFAVITMGVSKKTGKIEAYVDTNMQAWIDKYGDDDPDFVKKVNQDALDYCSTQADNCQLMHGVEELINDNK